MPYTKIVWIKLFLSLLSEDDRFLYQLNESQQLLYIKLLMLAGITNNKIVKNPRFICHKINYHHEEVCFMKDVDRIMEVFPKLKVSDDFYYFENFSDLHNWYTEDKSKIWNKTDGSSNGSTVGSSNGSVQNKNKNKNKNIYIHRFTPPTVEEVSTYCKERHNAVDPKRFIDHYTANGWIRGKTKIKDWRACVRTWERSEKPKKEMNVL